METTINLSFRNLLIGIRRLILKNTNNIKFCPSNNIQQQNRKSSEVKHLTNDLELRKLQSEIQKFKNRLNQSRSPHYEHTTLEKHEPNYDNYDNSVQKSFNYFSDTFKKK